MSQPPDLEARVAALETSTRVLNAMREDLVELRTQMESRFAEMDRGFAEMRSKFDMTAAGQQQIVHLLDTLIERDQN